MTSPYHQTAANLRENGYHVLPVAPGTKVPGQWTGSNWSGLPGWTKYCDGMPPEFVSDQWERWPEAGICVAHGNIIGLDLDTDRGDVAEALHAAVTPPDVRRRGSKGWLGYYRPGAGLDGLSARVRWYDKDGAICVELLLHGTQSVLPPTIHPDTGKPYRWLTPDTLEGTDISDLPEFAGSDVEALDREFARIGLTRQVPRQANIIPFIPAGESTPDLEKPYHRSVNDRALEADAIDTWFPLLSLPKTKQTGHGAWRAVPSWRPSGSGRAPGDRNANLGVHPTGIQDFARGESYTPISLVMAARQCHVSEATEWLEQYIRPEAGMQFQDVVKLVREDQPEQTPAPRSADVHIHPSALQKFLERGSGDRAPVSNIEPSSDAEFDASFPDSTPIFPVQDFERDLTGLLRDLTIRIDAGSRMRSDQGAFGSALSLMSVCLGGVIELRETGLRTNLYVLGTANSGAGKSSAASAMKKVATEVGVLERFGGSDFTSGAAILRELAEHNSNPNKLFCIDEFGDVMRRILGAKSASHEQDIRRILKDVYSAGDSIYQGKSKAGESRVDITNPHLCLYGISTFEAFWEGLDGASFRDGLIARFVSIPVGNTEVQRPKSLYEEEVRDGFTQMMKAPESSGNVSSGWPMPVTVHSGLYSRYEADWVMNQRHSERAKLRGIVGAPSIIMRISEMAMKIAMISAAGRAQRPVVMLEEDYELGCAVSQWSAISMINAIQKYYIESEAHRNVKRITEIIEIAGKRGATKSDITRKTQGMTGRDRDDAIKTATEAGSVFCVDETTTGRTKRTYYSRKAIIEMGYDEKNDQREDKPRLR